MGCLCVDIGNQYFSNCARGAPCHAFVLFFTETINMATGFLLLCNVDSRKGTGGKGFPPCILAACWQASVCSWFLLQLRGTNARPWYMKRSIRVLGNKFYCSDSFLFNPRFLSLPLHAVVKLATHATFRRGWDFLFPWRMSGEQPLGVGEGGADPCSYPLIFLCSICAAICLEMDSAGAVLCNRTWMSLTEAFREFDRISPVVLPPHPPPVPSFY